jgi:hypothetical protein
MMDDKQKRYEKIKGTKCESCCDADWCWNALTSLRDACLGPFKDLDDFKIKWNEFQKMENEKADIDGLERRIKREEHRDNKSLCDHKTMLARKKRDEEGKDE